WMRLSKWLPGFLMRRLAPSRSARSWKCSHSDGGCIAEENPPCVNDSHPENGKKGTSTGSWYNFMNAMHDLIAYMFQQEAGRVIAALYTSMRDLEVVEDAVQDALVLAMERWPVDGVPPNPGAWITTAARHKAIDRLRREITLNRKIRDARIPYQVPPADAILERIDAVLSVLYLIFNAGYTAPMGNELIRHDLCAEAIRLTRILTTLLAKEPDLTEDAEALGLLALMLLQDSRRKARVNGDGQLVLLEDQERTLWDQEEIAEGAELLERALAMRSPGPYQTQAAINVLHAQARRPEETDWAQIVALYDVLYEMTPSPVVELNRAVAVAMAEG